MTLAAGWSSSILFVLGACACASSTLLPAGSAVAPPAAAAPRSAVPASPPAQGRVPAQKTADLLAQLGRAEAETTAEALITLRSRAASLSPDERQQAIQAAQTLVERLTTEAANSEKTLPAALALLGALGTHEATPKLVALLRYRLLEDQQLDKDEEAGAPSLLAHTADPQRTARRERLRTEGQAAMDALGQLGAPAAGAVLVEGSLAFSPDTGALALARIREPEATPTLLRMLSGQLLMRSYVFDPDQPRKHAVQLLGTLRPADGVAPLTALLADRKQSISLREEAGKALALYALTAPNRWTQIETALVQFADSTRPDKRQFNLRNQFQFEQSARCPSNGAWWMYIASAEDTYWTLLAAAPALGLARGRKAIVRLRRALETSRVAEGIFPCRAEPAESRQRRTDTSLGGSIVSRHRGARVVARSLPT